MVVTISKTNGEVDLNRLLSSVNDLADGVYLVTIKAKSSRRSISQNVLLWLWLRCIADHTGHTAEELKSTFATMFLTWPTETPMGVRIVTHGTSEISKNQFTQFLESIKAFSLMEFGIDLPDPDDHNFEVFLEWCKK